MKEIRYDNWFGRRRREQCRCGVTLIEMMVVIAIISLLVSMVIAVATRIQNQNSEQLTKNAFGILDAALREYYEYRGTFPNSAGGGGPVRQSEILYEELDKVPAARKMLEGLRKSLVADRDANGILGLYDPWGTAIDYRYGSADTFPKLESAGPDRDFGITADNIKNR